MSGQRNQREPQSSGSLSEAERDQSAPNSFNQDHLLRSQAQGKERDQVQEVKSTGEEDKSTQASSDQANMSSSSSLYSASTRAGSTSTASTQTLVEPEKRSSMSRAMDKIRSKVTGSERLSGDMSESEKAKAKEMEKQQRKEDYEKLAMDYRIKYGLPGAGVWHI